MPVYEYVIKNNVEYVRLDEKYKLPFSDNEKDVIIEVWEEFKEGIFFNGDNIGLCDIRTDKDKTIMVIGHTDFYSLLVTNIINSQIQEFEKCFRSQYKDDEHRKILMKLLDYYEKLQKQNYKNFRDLIRNGGLANALAVSVLLRDRENDVLLTRRTSKVAIGKNLYSVTATGALDQSDWEQKDPIIACAVRELKEELNINISCDAFEIKSIVAGVKKKQPVAIVNVTVDHGLSDLLENASNSEDYDFEVKDMYICPAENIAGIIQENRFTEAAEYHLRMIENNK